MKRTILLPLLMLVSLFASAQETNLPISQDKNCYTLQNPSYAVGFNDSYGLPVWSCYIYTPIMKLGKADVPEEWITDTRIKRNKATAKEYDSVNLCKTQMFPKGHATTNSEVQKSTYLSSNILPMSQSLKEHIWDRITEEIEETAEKYGKVFVYSGPVFEEDPSRNKFIFNNRVVMPKSFYRLYVYYDEGKAVYRCYKFANRSPNDYERKCELDNFSYNIYKLEAETGVDFLNQSVDAFFRKDKMQFLETRINQ